MATWLCFLLTLLSVESKAQYPSANSFIQQIDEINESDQTAIAKIDHLKSLINKIQSLNPEKDSVYARAIHRLGDLYRQTGDFEKSIALTKEAVAINSSKDAGAETSFLANSYYNLGLYYGLLYLFPESHAYFDSCIAIGERYPSKRKIVFMAFEQKAFTYYTSGDFQKAIDVADQGILLAKNNDDSIIEALLLSQKAQAQIELSNLSDAKINIRRAVKVLSGVNLPEYLATAYSILARLSEQENDPASSIKYYNQAFSINKRIGNFGQCSRDLMNLGYFYDHELKDVNHALICFQSSIEYAVKARDNYQLAGLYNNIGNVYWKQHKYVPALRYFQKGLNNLPIHFSDTSISSNPSATDLKMVANDYFIITLLSNKAETLVDLYKLDGDRSHLAAALRTFEAADQSIDFMRWKQQGEQSKFYWRNKTKKVYEKAIAACYYAGAVEQSYYFFEKSRAVLLSDQLNELGAKQYISSGDRNQEQFLRVKIYSLSEQLSQSKEGSAEYDFLKQQLLAAQNNFELFIKNLEIKYPQYYRYKYDNSITPLNVLRQSLSGEQQTLLEFFTGDSLLYILQIAPKSIALKIIPKNDYEKNINTVLSLCSDRGILNSQYHEYSRASYALYRQLIEPLNIQTKRIIVSSDEQIIPIESLLFDTLTRNAYLLKKYAFSYSYTAAMAIRQNKTDRNKNDFLGIAPVTYNPHLQQEPLPGADVSLANIKKLFGSCLLMTKADASKENFLARFAGFRIVQIYSHAEADSIGKSPLLYLHDSALLLPQIQIQENLRTEMIVLSACKTTVGKNIRGEGIYSLARGFAAAGIPSTVTTLWKVDNKATYQLTELFYGYIRQGYTKDEALQKAKLDMLGEGDGMYALPYYWAGAIVLGNAAKISGLEGASSLTDIKTILIMVSIIILSLLTITVVLLRKRSSSRRS